MPKISKENAKEMQLKSAAKRKENAERRAVIREWLFEELMKPASKQGNDTLGLYFVKKALQNTAATVTLQDLERLQRILGEDTINLKIDGTDPAANLAELIEQSRKSESR